MPVTLYHNPRCTKSRTALKLLEDRGLTPRVIEYLKTPPSAAELKKLIAMLGIAPRALLRTREAEYKQAGLDRPDVSDAQILEAMAKYPRLIERPIVVNGNQAVLGRPPEKILTIL